MARLHNVLGLPDRLRSATVRVQDRSAVYEGTVEEMLLDAHRSMSVLDVLRESIETRVVDLTRSASAGEETAPETISGISSGEELNPVQGVDKK